MEDSVGRAPKESAIDFAKLEKQSLIKLLRHYGYSTHPDVSKDVLVLAVTRAFEKAATDEDEIINNFIGKCSYSIDGSRIRGRKKQRGNDYRSDPARPGEQVAAKTLRTNENGAWILANVIDFDYNTQTYEVQDEDDTSRVVTLPYCDVRRLEDTGSYLRRGDRVLAVFPETTSFYRAVVAKNPRAPAHGNSSWEVVVRFDDDEDDSGKAPARRIPARFVIRRSDVEDDDEDDE